MEKIPVTSASSRAPSPGLLMIFIHFCFILLFFSLSHQIPWLCTGLHDHTGSPEAPSWVFLSSLFNLSITGWTCLRDCLSLSKSEVAWSNDGGMRVCVWWRGDLASINSISFHDVSPAMPVNFQGRACRHCGAALCQTRGFLSTFWTTLLCLGLRARLQKLMLTHLFPTVHSKIMKETKVTAWLSGQDSFHTKGGAGVGAGFGAPPGRPALPALWNPLCL